MNLLQTDLEVLELLTWKVRLATGSQLESFREGMGTRIERLVTSSLVKKAGVVIAVLTLDQPLCRWSPGDKVPNFAALSHRLIWRREQAERSNERIYWAAARAVQIVGGVGGRLRQPLQVEHDLGVAQVCLARRSQVSEANLRWLGEDCFRKLFNPRGKIPDAVLCDVHGRVERAIELGGLYPAERLRLFHQHCARRSLPYELW